MIRCVVAWLLCGVMCGEAHATLASTSLSQPGPRIMQKGQWYRVRLGELSQGYRGTIRSLSWQIRSAIAWPQPPEIMLCLDNACQRLDNVTGRSKAFTGMVSRGEWQVILRLPGGGAQYPAVTVLGVTLTVTTHIDEV